jgi:hypothetical protein
MLAGAIAAWCGVGFERFVYHARQRHKRRADVSRLYSQRSEERVQRAWRNYREANGGRPSPAEFCHNSPHTLSSLDVPRDYGLPK